MKEIKPSPPAAPFTTSVIAAAIVKKKRKISCVTRVKTNFLAFMVSLKERFRCAKANLLGLVMKVKVKNERGATEADLKLEKMQVEAAAEAEKEKNELYNSM